MKKNIHQKSKFSRGFTLIESLVFLFLFAVISVTFLQVYVAGSRIIIDSKNRLGAVALANQKMEIIRSLEYEAIGTRTWNGSGWVYGIPGGELLQEEDVSVNTRQYHVSTFVQYVDDTFDRTTSSSPRDTIPTDYKRVRVEVTWGEDVSQKVILFGNFTPNGMETAVSGGTLSINVLHSDGSGVVGADVNIRNSAGTINVNASTDATGNVTLPGTPAGNRIYTITVSKSDYFGAITYPPYPTSTYNPINLHASVVANTLNQTSIVMDRDIDLPLKTVDPFDQAIPSISLNVKGGRILGTIPSTGESVVTVNDINRVTNSSGEYTYSNQSYGIYNITVGSSSSSQYELYKILPETSSIPSRIDAAPGSNQQQKIVLLFKNFASLKTTVQNNATQTPISGATVQLRKDDGSYDITGTTDQYGFAFFPQNTTPLVAGSYTLTVSAAGYQQKTSSITIGSDLVKETVNLTAN